MSWIKQRARLAANNRSDTNTKDFKWIAVDKESTAGAQANNGHQPTSQSSSKNSVHTIKVKLPCLAMKRTHRRLSDASSRELVRQRVGAPPLESLYSSDLHGLRENEDFSWEAKQTFPPTLRIHEQRIYSKR